ncbi:MAG: endonuclease/exonuclease/phosphatase family protein [Planctomycetota bacterium]
MSETDPTTGVPTTLRGSVALLLFLAGGAATAGSVLGLLGDRPWFLDLFSHFRLQYTVGLLVAVVGVLVLRKWKSAGVFGAALALNLVLISPLWIAPTQPTGDGPALRVLAYNVLTSNPQKSAVIDWVNAQGADVLILQEVNREWVDRLDEGLADYERLPTGSIREDNFGMAVYLRGGIEPDDTHFVHDAAEVPRIEVSFRLGGYPVRVVGVHTLPPVGAEYSRRRGAQLAEVADRVNQAAEPVVVAGDLNATPWSAPLRRLLRDTGLRDSARGFGHQGTWPTGLAWSGLIPIDHALVSPEWRVEDRRLGPIDLGSDHRAVVVDLRLSAS